MTFGWLLHPLACQRSLWMPPSGDKLVRFPSVSICKQPYSSVPKPTSNADINLWKNITACNNDSLLSPPYFLSYLENCLETNENENVTNLIDKMSYDINTVTRSIETHPFDETPLKYGLWENHKNQIIHSNFHFDYGHCITIDIAPLSESNGKYAMEYGSEQMKLFVSYYNSDVEVKKSIQQQAKRYFYLHNGTNIHNLGTDIRGNTFLGGEFRVRHYIFLLQILKRLLYIRYKYNLKTV